MSDLRLAARTPLGFAEPHAATVGPVEIREMVDVALASVAVRAGREADFRQAADASGVPLPGPGRAERGAVWSAFWTGPDVWMVEAPLATHEDVAPLLRRAFGPAASVTEQTDGWARFAVECPEPPRLFERLCALDMARAAPGDAHRTVVEHLGCFVLVRAPTRFELLTPRSSAGSFLHALETAARAAF